MPEAKLRVVRGPDGDAEGEIRLDEELVLGREGAPTPELSRDILVSRRHARVLRRPDGSFVLEDLDSTNGTYLNGWKIPAPQVLSSGDRILVGQTVLELELPRNAMTVAQRSVVIPGTAFREGLRPQPKEAALYANGVLKSYGDREVLKGVDLEIAPGEIVGLLGANGAGKTTFVSIVAGLRKADGGTVQVAGVDALRHSHRARQFLGIAQQETGVYPLQSVRRNLEFFGEIAGLRGAELRERVEEVGEALSLTPIFDQHAGALSGGQQRRLHTGMAMINHPPLLILDEPTVGADVRTRQEILDLVKKLAAEGRAICYSTHYMPEIEDLGASVAILDGGTIIARGSIAELVAKHSTPALELRFDGPAPTTDVGYEATREDSVLRIKSAEPSSVAAAVMNRLGPDAVRLRDVEIVRPSLESVYLALTDRRYSSGGQNGTEAEAPTATKGES